MEITPTTSLPIGIILTIVQNEIYALPTEAVWVTSDQVLEFSLDEIAWVSSGTEILNGAAIGFKFVRCTVSDAVVVCKEVSDLEEAEGTPIPGPPGPQGVQGPKGDEGDVGPEGPIGDVGPTGPQGEQGPVGPVGPVGPIGPIGIGEPGPQGIKGDKGDTGVTGPQGPIGNQGPQGLPGPQGPLGPTGLTGPEGPQGIQGIQGLTGPAGADGVDGSVGATGPKGDKGDKGDTGSQGIQGIPGPEGPMGPEGPIGDTGPAGTGADLQYLGDYVTPRVYNDGDIVYGADGIAYICVVDGTTTPPEPWPSNPYAAGPHAASHETNGSDALTNISGSIITSGTVADIRLSTNIPLKNAANVFSQKQWISMSAPQLLFSDNAQATGNKVFDIVNNGQQLRFRTLNDTASSQTNIPLAISRNGDVNILGNLTGAANVPKLNTNNNFSALMTIAASNATLNIIDTASAVNLKKWNIQNYLGNLYFQTRGDLEEFQSNNVMFLRSGGICERDRNIPMGEWTDAPFNAGNFTGNPGTWTVTSASFSYMLLGKTMWINLGIYYTQSNLSTAGTLLIRIPSGFISTSRVTTGYVWMQKSDGSYYVGTVWSQSGANTLVVYNSAYPASIPAGGLGLFFTFPINIQ